jgi:hypothetical protein
MRTLRDSLFINKTFALSEQKQNNEKRKSKIL